MRDGEVGGFSRRETERGRGEGTNSFLARFKMSGAIYSIQGFLVLLYWWWEDCWK